MTSATFSPRRGQNTVELALSISVLMVLTIGVVDLGRAVWLLNSVSYLAREGARYGIIPSRTANDIKNYVVSRSPIEDDVDGVFDTGPGSPANIVVIRGACANPGPASPVVVTISTGFRPITAPLWVGSGGLLTLSATSQMFVEQGNPGVDCACGGSCP